MLTHHCWLQNDETLSLEVRMRIKKAIELQRRDFGEAEDLIFQLKLVSEEDYLRKLLTEVDENDQEIIRTHLSRLSSGQR